MTDIEYVDVDPNAVEIDAGRHEGTEECDRLLENVRHNGILQSPGVRRDGSVLKAVFGNGRLFVARKLGMRAVRVAVLTRPMPESAFLALTLSENFARQSLSLREQVDRVAEYARRTPDLTGKELAAKVGIGEAKLCRLLAIAGDPTAYEAIRAGQLTAESVAYDVAKAPAAVKAGVLALAMNNATRDEVRRAGRKKPAPEAPSPPPGKTTRVVCPVVETGIRVIVSGPVSDLVGLIRSLETAATMARKAERDNLTLKLAAQTWLRKPAAKRKAKARP